MATSTLDWPLWSTTARLVVTDPARLIEARAVTDAVLAEIETAASRFRPDSELAARSAEFASGAEVSDTLHIDWTRCDGRGLCTEILPELLTRDDWGFPLAPRHGSDVPVPDRLVDAAVEAVALCPRLALSLPQEQGRPGP